jgi:hypothetical protein
MDSCSLPLSVFFFDGKPSRRSPAWSKIAAAKVGGAWKTDCACLVPNFSPKFYYVKRKFSIISKYRHMYEVLNVDEIKN